MALVASQVELDAAAPIGSPQDAGFFARTLGHRGAESRAEKAGRLAGARARGRWLTAAKVIGGMWIAVAAVGFIWARSRA